MIGSLCEYGSWLLKLDCMRTVWRSRPVRVAAVHAVAVRTAALFVQLQMIGQGRSWLGSCSVREHRDEVALLYLYPASPQP